MNDAIRHDDPQPPPPCDLLIVEDDPIQAEELACYLRRGGLAVQSLPSGSDAIHRVAALQPKVALVDYNLPDLDGVTVAERIRRLSPQTALIVMSGRIDGLSPDTLARLGIYSFLNKPVEAGGLRRSVRRMVRFAARTGLPAVTPPRGLAFLLS